MDRLIDAITAHWRERAALRSLHVPEWGTTIHWRPPTLAVMAEIDAARSEGGDVAAAVRALVLLARDAEGRPVLSRGDEAVLRNEADPAVVMRIVAQMLEGDGDAAAASAAAKNS